ncbi:DEAD/DEAH box helicase [Paralimibaculum aggregatum]|uniref:DEAD/DEAH box helicase n=1 Tax=Paralimibaculum aggregatum TaxID=3036245 RepID=A0ABQ6LT09_9RHOB|nr:DEAD/DEAH box helicase [Limibaculum sp. NKW23]GMG85215.1 DEAD/DEAH box helicase [Limibaculum sp. NKW23]
MPFNDLGLDADLLKAIDESGYTEPTPIQAAAIPHALKGKDVLGIAQTGTGKTASFVLPMINILAKGRARARMPRSLILCPTRELAAQVSENFEKYGKYHKLTMALLIGGVNFNQQDKLIDRGVDVLIATPGRLLDHFERGKLMLTGIQIMVVDEADRMLDMGFIPDIERIFGLTPFTRQTLFFSATMAPEITRITETFLHAPERVEVARQATAVETIAQRLVAFRPSRRDVADREKRDCLRRLIRAEGDKFSNAIIFCNRKRDVGVLHKSLVKHGFNAGAIHGDLDQSVRMATLNGFRDGEIALLVASDVAARGLDIPNVSHVFNFDVPTHPEDYVHRIGRTGRAGRSGTAITLCAPSDTKYLEKIEELIGKQIPRDESAPAAEPAPEAAEAAPAREETETRGRSRGGRGGRDRDRGGDRGGDREAEREQRAPRERERDRGEQGQRGNQSGGGRGGRGRGGREADRPVVGLGDHVPAFLLREVKLKKPAPRKSAKAAAAADAGETVADGGETKAA